MSETKAAARVVPFKGLPFTPRFAYGDQCQLAEVTGEKDGTPLGFGFARMTGANIPWTIHYDEVLLVLSGVLRIRTKAGVLEAGPHESIWLPAGTELIYDAEDCLMAYAVHPVDWRKREAEAGRPAKAASARAAKARTARTPRPKSVRGKRKG